MKQDESWQSSAGICLVMAFFGMLSMLFKFTPGALFCFMVEFFWGVVAICEAIREEK